MTGFGRKVGVVFQVAALAAVCVLTVQNGYALCATGPTTTYQFVGQCTDCTGTGTGSLTVQNYTLGAGLTYCNFVSFSYHSNLTSFTITSSNFTSLSGGLPASLPASANVSVVGPGNNALTSNANGSWFVGASDYGPTSSWSLPQVTNVPVMSVPMLIGLALMLGLIGAAMLKWLPNRRSA